MSAAKTRLYACMETSAPPAESTATMTITVQYESTKVVTVTSAW